MIEVTSISKGQANLYATASDFCRIFKEDMQNLYLLSLLLTADSEKAEQCFVSGLEDCANGNQVFREWARSWARRAIIKNAIRLIAPDPANADGISNAAVSAATKDSSGNPAGPELRAELTAVFGLQPFERFAFVMSVLEGYSDRDCALLLGCGRESLIAARTRALQQMGRVGKAQSGQQSDAKSKEKSFSLLKLGARTPLATPA